MKNNTKAHLPVPFEGLDLLLKKRNGPCLSMLLPFYSKQSLRKQNVNLLKGALAKASLLLECYDAGKEEKEKIREELQKFALSFDPARCLQSIGIFIADDITRIVFFPFEVTETVLVADSFEIRDVLYLRQYLSPYYIMMIGDGVVRLFLAEGTSLQEVKDDLFPVSSLGKRGNKKADFALAAKDFERDKGRSLDSMIAEFMDENHHRFPHYMSNGAQTLIVAGSAPVVHHFKNEFEKRKVNTGIVVGNFKDDLNALTTAAWKECTRMREVGIKGMINSLDNKPLRGRAKGLRNVWQAANAGKGLLLLVERDFRKSAYIPKGSEQIRLHPPKGDYTYVADAVDDAIEKVLRKHGQVFITGPGELGRFENIGMMLRF